MDLIQRKLTKAEWESIEKPVSLEEQQILKMICKGYHDINYSCNNTLSIINFFKMENKSDEIHLHIFNTYFIDSIQSLSKKYNFDYKEQKNNKLKKINSIDKLRLEQNNKKNIESSKDKIFEYMLITLLTKLLKNYKSKNIRWVYYYLSLSRIIKYDISNVNNYIVNFINIILKKYEEKIKLKDIIKKSHNYIEKNEYIYTYDNIKLYDHQKHLFTIFKNNSENPSDNENSNSKLVLYIAPTATGKTLSPIGLSEKYRVIFLCAARHVGISLAKSAVSVGKKVAFAFGCNDYEDIRLHYFSANDYIRHNVVTDENNVTKCLTCGRTKCQYDGQPIKYKDGTKKLDHSNGGIVEIMICDIKSYLPAMYYMLAFNNKNNIITYWDEPTITLDYDSHPCHHVINKNWSKNIIPNIVLSSATLPKEEELLNTITDFKSRFENSEIHTINSYDCKKTIPIINSNGFAELPHYLYNDYNKILECVEHCESYKTLLRYFDLEEISKFIIYINEKNYILEDYDVFKLEEYFTDINDINMNYIKLYYLEILKRIKPNKWNEIYNYFQETRNLKIKPNNKGFDDKELYKNNQLNKIKSLDNSNDLPKKDGLELKRINSIFTIDTNREIKTNPGIYITTKDAYSLSDGPTIYIAENVDKVAKFCLSQAKIPSENMNIIMQSIHFNNNLNKKICALENDLEDSMQKYEGQEKKLAEGRFDDDTKKKMRELDTLRSLIKSASLNDVYVPNKLRHIEKWTNIDDIVTGKPFTSNITNDDVEEIMAINNIEDIWKILLLMGIGLFSQTTCIEYTEIVKKLATTQKLYLIIANGDYIYGTNYQFCHGFISKDIINMTQEKAIQAMGRIGRNKLQFNYTVRYRDDNIINKLFTKESNKPEVRNMNILFNTIEQ